MAHIPDQIRK